MPILCNTWAVPATGSPPQIRAAVYLRQSRDFTGEGDAVDRQREDCQRIAEQRGWTVIGEYVDNDRGASDRRKRRPAYDQLVDDFAGGRFDALVCYDLDRLTRQPRQIEDWIEAAEDRGLVLVTANGEADLSTDGGRLFARIKASVARAEIERKAERQRRAALQRADRGRPPLGVRLTGYTSGGAVVDHEADVVRGLFARFAAGESLRGLAQWLTTEGVAPRRGGRWNPSSVSTMLTNPRYAGRAVYRGEVTGRPGAWEALVDEDTFDLVQARLADPRRKTNRQGTDRKHLGSGLYLCGVCGSRLQSWSGNRYRCSNGCLTRAQGPIDGYVLAIIRARLAQPDVADAAHPDADQDGARLSDEARRLRARLDQVGEDYDAGLIDGRRYKTAREKIQAQLADVDAERARLLAPRAAAETLLAADPVAAFDAATLMVRRGVIDALCTVRVGPAPRGSRTFDPGSVEIEWSRTP